MCDEYDELHLDELRKKWDAERSMWKEFAQNNLLGRELEKVGEFEKAIELYEQNVARRDEGSHPYERLAVIYSKMKKYDDVKRILEIVIDLYESDVRIGDKPAKQKSLTKFKDRLEKVEKKMSLPMQKDIND